MWPRLWSFDAPLVFQSSQLFWGDHLTEAENDEREEPSVGIKGCRTLGCQSTLWAFILLIFYRAENCIFHFRSSAAWFGFLFRTQVYLKSTSQSINQLFGFVLNSSLMCSTRVIKFIGTDQHWPRAIFALGSNHLSRDIFSSFSLLLRQKKWTLQKCCKLWFRWACVPRTLHGPSDGILNSFRQAYFSHSEFLALFKNKTRTFYGFFFSFFRRSFKIRNTTDGDRRPITWRWPMWPFRCRRILENDGKHSISKNSEIQFFYRQHRKYNWRYKQDMFIRVSDRSVVRLIYDLLILSCDWLIDWSIYYFVDWSIDWLIDWVIDCSFDWLIDWLCGRFWFSWLYWIVSWRCTYFLFSYSHRKPSGTF